MRVWVWVPLAQSGMGVMDGCACGWGGGLAASKRSVRHLAMGAGLPEPAGRLLPSGGRHRRVRMQGVMRVFLCWMHAQAGMHWLPALCDPRHIIPPPTLLYLTRPAPRPFFSSAAATETQHPHYAHWVASEKGPGEPDLPATEGAFEGDFRDSWTGV